MVVQVIIPNLNYGRFVGEAIQSVLDQTYGNWELYVCDGGSTDNSLEVIKSFTDPRIHLVEDKSNLGIRMNNASKLSKSKYVVILASDDKLYPKFLEENVRVMENTPSVDFIYNSYVDATGNILTLHPHYEYRVGLLMECFYMGVFWFIRRELWEEIEGYRDFSYLSDNDIAAFDYDLCLRCEEAGATFKYLDKSLGWYRRWEGSDTGRHSPEWLAKLGENTRVLARKRRGL